MSETLNIDSSLLLELERTEMPFGQFKGRPLLDLPEGYLVWFQRNGWPPGKLGRQLALALEIKHNGLVEIARQATRTSR